MAAATFLEDYFEPVTAVMTPELAKAIVDLKPDPQATARVRELGEKSDAGTLTNDEWEEYKAFVDAGDMIALLKAKARRYLARNGA